MNKNNFDIQKIIEVLENKRNEAIKEYEKQSSILKTTDERQDVIDEIRKIFQCKYCGGNTPQAAYVIAPDYCPNCGAKMDGEPHDP